MQRFVLFCILLLAALRTDAQSITWLSPCTDTTFCFDPGSCSSGTVVLSVEAVTGCGTPKINYSYRIDLGNNGSIDIQSTEDTLREVLPAGTHQVLWRATDVCGNLSQGCSYLVTVKDCIPPNLLCVSGLTKNLLVPDCIASFNAEDFILTAGDNCTPKAQLKYGIRRPGNGSGFPADTSLTFTKCEQGQYPVQIWVRDENGLANSCNSYVVVQDNTGFCICEQSAGIFFQGCARSADSARLDEYSIRATLAGMPLQAPAFSDTLVVDSQDSCYNAGFLDLPLNGAYSGSVWATRSGTPLEGVSTFDLVLINRHILGQQPLENFYQVLAADVNRSNSISTFDIIEIRKLILGLYDSLPQVPVWRMIRPVPDPLNLTAFAEVRDTYPFSVPNLYFDTLFPQLNFVGIKMGDANANATFHSPRVEDRGGVPLLLMPDNPALDAGQGCWVAFRLSENIALEGWQLALHTDPERVEIHDVRGVPPQCVAVLPSGELRVACLPDAPAVFSAGDALFEVLVSAKTAGQLSGALRLGREHLVPEVYPANAQAGRPLDFRFERPTTSAVWSVASPQPNPFSAKTTFAFSLEAPADVLLEIFDLSGKPVFRALRRLEAGRQEWVLSGEELPVSGVYLYRVSVGGEVGSGRLVRG